MRRAVKISAWTVGAIALLVVVIAVVLFVAGNTNPGRAMIEKLTYRLTSGHVSLTGLNGAFPQSLMVGRVQLSDDRGVWLRAERLTLEWSPLALLARRVQIDELHAANVDMDRLPEPSIQSPNNGPVSIPRIDVARMSVDVLNLGAQLAGSPASLTLHGDAHLRSATDMVIDASAHRIDGDGSYDLQLRFDPQRMDAALKVHEPAGGPLENLLQVPGLGALAATVTLAGPRAMERLDLAIGAGPLHGDAHGTFNLSDLSADLDFAFDSPALAPRRDLGWEHASLRGHWHGSVKAPVAHGHIEAAQLRLPGSVQVAALNGDLVIDSGTATLHALIAGLRIPGSQPQLLQDSPVRIVASLRLNEAARPLDVAASHRLFSLHASAETSAVSAGRRSATLELKLPDLAELATLVGEDLRGSALVRAQLQNDAASTHMIIEANAALRVGTQAWAGMVGDSAALQLSGVFTEGAITLEKARFTGRAVSLTASGELSKSARLHARWGFNASDLKTLSPALAGTLSGSGTIDGPTTSFGCEAQVTSTVSVHGSPSGGLSAAINMHGLPSNLSGTFAAQGLLDGAPLHVDVDVMRAQGRSYRALVHRAEWKSARLDGDITVAQEIGQSRGQLALQVGQLADLKNLLGADIAGSLHTTLGLRPDQGRTRAELHVDAQNLAAGQFISNAQLTASGFTDAAEFRFEAQVPQLRGAKASLSAAGSLNLDARKVAVASATVNYRGQDMRLLSPAQVALANGISVDELKMGAQQAVLSLKGEISPALDLSVSLRKVQPSLVNVFAPDLLASGRIEAQAEIKGSATSPTGRVQLTATDVRMADDAALGLPPLDLHATVQLKGDTADVNARLMAGTASQISVTGRAPLAAQGALDMKINGTLDVGMINPLLEGRGQHATGDLAIDATVAGSIAEPKIAGTVDLSKGSVRDYARGVSLTNITASIAGSERTLQIKSMTATAAPGTVSVTGKIGVLEAGIPVDLKIKAENAQPVVSKLVTSNLNADVRVSGSARERLDVAGNIHLNRTLIGIPNSLPPDVAVLEVRRRGKQAPAVPVKQLVIGLDVTVQAPQEFLVQGRGLDAEMGGELHISGTTDSSVVSGAFELQRGSFSLGGNKLDFTSGRVYFTGSGLKNTIDPALDFTAQTTVGTTSVKLQISGLADAPQFEFTSTPSLGQDEIMAQLLFGQNISQLSALQVAQIGATLATLSGVGGDGGLNPLVKIQKSLGLDRLTVGSGATTNTAAGPESTGASIAAGRYISKRVYVEAKQTTLGTTQLETDVDLTKHLKLQTRLGNGTASVQGTTPENDPGSSIGLIYQFEY